MISYTHIPITKKSWPQKQNWQLKWCFLCNHVLGMRSFMYPSLLTMTHVSHRMKSWESSSMPGSLYYWQQWQWDWAKVTGIINRWLYLLLSSKHLHTSMKRIACILVYYFIYHFDCIRNDNHIHGPSHLGQVLYSVIRLVVRTTRMPHCKGCLCFTSFPSPLLHPTMNPRRLYPKTINVKWCYLWNSSVVHNHGPLYSTHNQPSPI